MTGRDTTAAARAGRLAAWKPLGVLTDLVRVVADTWRLADENRSTLNRLEGQMADNSTLLNDVATKLRDRVFPAVSELVAENTRLATENASLKGEDVAESAAAENVRTATDEVADLFAADPTTPDVPPLDGGGDVTPAPVEGDTPVDPTV